MSDDDRRCTTCGKSVEDEVYQLWLFHTCRSCLAEPAPDRWKDHKIVRGTARKWAYYPRWHLVKHPERDTHWRTDELATDGGETLSADADHPPCLDCACNVFVIRRNGAWHCHFCETTFEAGALPEHSEDSLAGTLERMSADDLGGDAP